VGHAVGCPPDRGGVLFCCSVRVTAMRGSGRMVQSILKWAKSGTHLRSEVVIVPSLRCPINDDVEEKS